MLFSNTATVCTRTKLAAILKRYLGGRRNSQTDIFLDMIIKTPATQLMQSNSSQKHKVDPNLNQSIMSLPISALIVTSSKYMIRINKPTREDSGASTTATAVHGCSRAHKSVFNFITTPLKLYPQSSMSNIKTLIPYNTGFKSYCNSAKT